MADKQYKSIEYTFRDQRIYTDYYALYSIGMEYRKQPLKYHQNCRLSSDRQCVFQYTVSGTGALSYNNHTYSIRPGQAFLVEKPGAFAYYMPNDASHWEFKYIAVNLDSLNIWRDITQRFGRIITLEPDCELMRFWDSLYERALDNRMGSFFQASARAYEFMMLLMDTLQKKERDLVDRSISQQCLELIQSNYAQELTLSSMAEACSVSPSYLNRKFRETFGTSPVQYLIHHRIEIAASLLLRESMQVGEVAREVGFNDANYFTRTFRKIKGISPSKYHVAESIHTAKNTLITLEIGPHTIEEEVVIHEI